VHTLRQIRRSLIRSSATLALLWLLAALSGCDQVLTANEPDSGGASPVREGPFEYSVTYDPNDARVGTVPVDGTAYLDGDVVEVRGNEGALSNAPYSFDGWNTVADGTGTRYVAGDTLEVDESDIVLYAMWVPTISLRFDTSLGAGTEITLPLHGSQRGIEIDWGDGAGRESVLDSTLPRLVTHSYRFEGVYDVHVYGSLEGYGGTSDNAAMLREVLSWRRTGGIVSFADGFAGASNLTAVPQYLPEGVTVTRSMFDGAERFNGSIVSWETGTITDMEFMFCSTAVFNQDIGEWDVSAVRRMGGMFGEARVFNHDLSGWCVVNVELYRGEPSTTERYGLRWGGYALDDGHVPQWGTCP